MLVITLGLTACGKPPEAAPTGPQPVLLPANYKWLKPTAASALIKSTPGIGIIDVREDNERFDGRGVIAGAKGMPFYQDQKTALSAMDRNRTWLVYCAIGGRSELMAQTMAKLEFKHVYLLRGGFNDWMAAGLPVEK